MSDDHFHHTSQLEMVCAIEEEQISNFNEVVTVSLMCDQPPDQCVMSHVISAGQLCDQCMISHVISA